MGGVDEHSLPLDSPLTRGHARVYFAITANCNRECPWCSVYSSPRSRTRMALSEFAAALDCEVLRLGGAEIELQIEGGEPTVHPQFDEILEAAWRRPQVATLVLCTNGVLLPVDKNELKAWFVQRTPTGRKHGWIVKLSINHHLLAHDSKLFERAAALCALSQESSDFQVVLNVRLRKDFGDGDAWIVRELEKRALLSFSNVFNLQRYGRGRAYAGTQNLSWQEPFSVRDSYVMINPDGKRFVADLVGRSEAMRDL